MTAHAFGVLTGKTMEFEPGLNIIVGANETGKSTWHAATFAALCGYRDASNSTVDAGLKAREPWAGGGWSVSAEIVLDGARVVQISRDLSAPTSDRVFDVSTGRDLSGDIATPDGLDATRWLGLNRWSFAATAYVEQKKLRTYGPAGLRPTGSPAAGDETETAVDRIERYRQRVIGVVSDPRSPIGTALRARDRLDAADAELQELAVRAERAWHSVAKAEQAVRDMKGRAGAANLAAWRAKVESLQADLATARAQTEPVDSVESIRPADGDRHSRLVDAEARYRARLADAAGVASAATPEPEAGRRFLHFVGGRAPVSPAPPPSGPDPVLDAAARVLRDALAAMSVFVSEDADLLNAVERYHAQRETQPLTVPVRFEVADPEQAAALEHQLNAAQAEVRRLELEQPYAGHAAMYGQPYAYRVEPPTDDQLRVLAAEREAADEALSAAQSEHTAIKVKIDAVSGARQTYATAGEAYPKVERLDERLRATIAAMRCARSRFEQRFMNDVECRLQDWIEDVTAGTYTSVRVDPASLTIYLSAPGQPEIDAANTSGGMGDQAHLLLRLALHHSRRGTQRGPILLDEIFADTDQSRMAAILEILAKLAGRGHQVILFTSREIETYPVRTRLSRTDR